MFEEINFCRLKIAAQAWSDNHIMGIFNGPHNAYPNILKLNENHKFDDAINNAFYCKTEICCRKLNNSMLKVLLRGDT